MDSEKQAKARQLLFEFYSDRAMEAMFKGSMGDLGLNAQAVTCVVNMLAHATATMCVANPHFLLIAMQSHQAMVNLFQASTDDNAKTLSTTLAEILHEALQGANHTLQKL